jgi:LDH2 family malate/lactate/ureidoglycolate dehydrogenase
MKISVAELRQKILDTLEEKGFSAEDSKRIADYLMWAETSGIKTQGIIKMTGI